MNVVDALSAAAWLMAWGDRMRPGIRDSAIQGTAMCYWIALAQGSDTRGYAAAWHVLTAGQVREPLHAGLLPDCDWCGEDHETGACLPEDCDWCGESVSVQARRSDKLCRRCRWVNEGPEV